MHASLTPKNNLRLIAVSASIVAAVAWFGSVPASLFGIGALLGAVAGLLQLRALRQSQAEFLRAANALAVRRALASSLFGKIYLVLFWVSAVIFVTLSIVLLQQRFAIGWLAAYCCFAVVRDSVALPATFELQKRASSNDEFTPAI